MTIEELKSKLREAVKPPYDNEKAHSTCDDLLIEFIGDEEIKKIYDKSDFWYA